MEFGFREIKSSVKDCISTVARLLHSEEWVVPDLACAQSSKIKYPTWLHRRVNDNECHMAIEDIKDFEKEFNKHNIVNDFTAKMKDGKIGSYQAYYEYVQQYGFKYSAKVVDYESTLKKIEVAENNINKPLPMLYPM